MVVAPPDEVNSVGNDAEPTVWELLTVYVPAKPSVPVNWVVMVGEPGSDSV